MSGCQITGMPLGICSASSAKSSTNPAKRVTLSRRDHHDFRSPLSKSLVGSRPSTRYATRGLATLPRQGEARRHHDGRGWPGRRVKFGRASSPASMVGATISEQAEVATRVDPTTRRRVPPAPLARSRWPPPTRSFRPKTSGQLAGRGGERLDEPAVDPGGRVSVVPVCSPPA